MSQFNWDDHPIVKNESKESFNWDDHPVVDSPKAKASVAQTALEGFGKGASFGYLPQLQAGVERLTDAVGAVKDKALETIGLDQLTSIDAQLRKQGFKLPESSYVAVRDANVKRQAQQEKDNPWTAGAANLAGSAVTGIAMTPLLPATGGAATGAKLSARIAQGAVQGAKAGAAYGALANPGEVEGEISPLQIANRLDNAEKGAVFGTAFGAAVPVTGAMITAVATKLKVPAKEAAKAIRAAAERMGIKPTAAMLGDSEFVQNLESSLHQSPTIGGALVRRETVPVSKGLQKATGEILDDASQLSKFEAGEQAKREITEDVARKFQPSKDTFQDLSQYTKDIPSTKQSTEAVSRNILKIPEVEVLDLPLAKQVVKALEKQPTADQIKMLRGMVGREAEAAEGAASKAYWEMYGKLTKLEENTIKRGVIQSARTQPEGERIAEDMLGQLRGAKKSYSTEIGKVQDVAENARLGKVGNPSGFTNKVEAIRSEDVQDKLLNLADNRLNESIKSNFPKAFTTMRQAKLGDLARVSKDAEGEFVTTKLLGNTKNYTPEAKDTLFQNKAGMLDDVRLVNGSLPDKVGPSGTPQGIDYLNFLNPVNQARDIARYALYKGLTSDKVQAVVKVLSNSPQLKAIAESNPKAVNAIVIDLVDRMQGDLPFKKVAGDKKLKGKEKWAQAGFEKLKAHGAEGLNQEELMKDKKTKELLIQASDLEPGSAQLDVIIKQIDSAHPHDEQAVHWAKSNPKDPRAFEILKLNKGQ